MRTRTAYHPYATPFFALCEALGVIPGTGGQLARPDPRGRVRVVSGR